MLQLEHVWRTYPVGESEVVALQDVSLTIRDNDFVAIIGPSGSGKSTLLQIIGLLDRPTEGIVTLNGVDLADLDDNARSRLRLETLGFVFQRFHLLNELTALENVALPMEAAGAAVAERYLRAAELLISVGLEDRMHFRPARLSGGQRQRVAIARALANEPMILLADEPTGELHSEDRKAVIDLLRRFHQEGRTVIIVTHDMEVASVAKRRIEIRDGRVSEIGATADPDLSNATSIVQAPRTPRSLEPRDRPPRRRSGGTWRLLAMVTLAIAGVLGVLALTGQPPFGPAAPMAPPPVVETSRVARGEVQPEQNARLRSVTSGVILSVSVSVGNAVNESQEVARIRTQDGSVAVVTAPWRGTVTSLPIHQGDTVSAGTLIATIGDLSRLHIETTDVDEFLIPYVQIGGPVQVTLDALPGRDLTGTVKEISFQTEKTSEGDDHYPVAVSFDWVPPEVRPGMTARVRFPG
ncbi:MAG: ATP-binding cassette domain-containing protein [Chloroflexota bacterium]